jgi:ETC complex I subunit conserved region
MQEGTAIKSWLLDFEQASPKGVEPLMGWTSSADVLQQVRLRFDSARELEPGASAPIVFSHHDDVDEREHDEASSEQPETRSKSGYGPDRCK